VGSERVGSPVLEDTHRANSFRIERFVVAEEQASKLASQQVSEPTPSSKTNTRRGWGTQDVHIEGAPRMALRRVRPARTVRVVFREAKPAEFRDEDRSYEIAAAYGPWRTSGCWWALKSFDGAWDTEEWDVLAAARDGASIACLLTCDRARNAWRLEAFYD
jgi:protein ImuB